MEQLSQWIASFDSFVWGPPLLILLVGTHLFLTVYLKGIQRYVPLGIKLSIRKDNGDGDISAFSALSIALAATIGTGNIIGVATAIVAGGPGAVFWCWFCGIFGIATKYAEGILAIKYRRIDEKGMIRGGPMYAMESGMHCKWLGVVFSIFAILACFGTGNMVQSNAVSETIAGTFGAPGWCTGLVEAILLFLVVIGGLKSISRFCNAMIPLMVVLYAAGCFMIIGINYEFVVSAIKLIFHEAFSLKAVGGGLFGTVMMMSIRYGVARGLFSNESGLGTAPLVAASAKTINPVRQALISSTGTFWDTVCVCALTGIAFVSTVVKLDPAADFSKYSAPGLATEAFSQIPFLGKYILAISLAIFAFTTILGWFCYGRQAIHYLGGTKLFYLFCILYIPSAFLGAVSPLQMLWNVSDIANGLMAIPNLICIFWLSKVVKAETAKYLWSNKVEEPDPECIKINQAGKSVETE